MKVDINKRYRTECGYPVVIYAIHEGQVFGVHGAYQIEGGNWMSYDWTRSGHGFGPNDPSRLDLVEVRPERVVWISEYRDHLGFFDTKERADAVIADRIALHRVVLNEDTVWREDDA